MEKMQLGLELETEYFLLSVLLGATLGIVWDMVRVFRTLVPHGKILTFIGDFLYCLLFGFAVFTFSTALTGSIRYFTPVGMILGCVIERFSIGNGIVFLIRKFTEFIHKIIIRAKDKFVEKYPNFRKNKKNDENGLKDEIQMLYNK